MFSSPGRLWAALIWEYFSHLKERRRVGDEFLQLPFGADRRPGHLEGIPGLPRAPSFWVSPWRPLPPCGAAAGASSTCRGRPGSAARPLPLRPPPPAPPCWVRRLRQAPPILSSRSRRQSLEKWNLAAAAPCAGLAEPHWACSVAGASAALSRKLACCSPQLIPALSGLRDPRSRSRSRSSVAQHGVGDQ
ncbi:putative histone-lysine N-methyltransferase PRDM6 isoform X2 [Peromyscus californicus insignis]|uniref:putative histone-lysine N-methyltransferase PRDM6 isoform X2 n=1 Tax=Peromyscus californicus insignis TaxID=564181 RepID=UPI0022A745A1|nr:putative histone-lysine N-methyltransferase PRDM6 isoform X2 [Peromyscus californicus insignis]